jgi:glycine betaine catabolism A
VAGLQKALPASWYLDQAPFVRERERLLYREWFCAGRADQVGRPGSLVVVEVAGESVLLVRTRAGELRAHYNVCRHRGSQVVPCPPAAPGGPQAGPARKAGSLRCPYHSWTYRLEGELPGWRASCCAPPGARRSTASTRRPSGSARSGWRPGAGSCSCT